ncbi:hypothetical protein AB1283_00905 [Bacillus sp. S13(2024)]
MKYEDHEYDDGLGFFIGCKNALLMSIPFWLLVIGVIWFIHN